MVALNAAHQTMIRRATPLRQLAAGDGDILTVGVLAGIVAYVLRRRHQKSS